MAETPRTQDQVHADAVRSATAALNGAIERATAAGLRVIIEQHELQALATGARPVLMARVLKDV